RDEHDRHPAGGRRAGHAHRRAPARSHRAARGGRGRRRVPRVRRLVVLHGRDPASRRRLLHRLTAAMTSFHLADLWELVADAVPDRTALVCGSDRRTFGDLEMRANRLAHWMADAGVGRDDFVGLYLRNGAAYVEAMLAAYKLRAVPINVNY